MKKFLSLLISFGLAMTLVGCEDQGPAERAGEKIDETVEQVGEKVEEVVDEPNEGPAEEAGEKIDEAVEEAKEELEKAKENIKDSTQ